MRDRSAISLRLSAPGRWSLTLVDQLRWFLDRSPLPAAPCRVPFAGPPPRVEVGHRAFGLLSLARRVINGWRYVRGGGRPPQRPRLGRRIPVVWLCPFRKELERLSRSRVSPSCRTRVRPPRRPSAERERDRGERPLDHVGRHAVRSIGRCEAVLGVGRLAVCSLNGRGCSSRRPRAGAPRDDAQPRLVRAGVPMISRCPRPCLARRSGSRARRASGRSWARHRQRQRLVLDQ